MRRSTEQILTTHGGRLPDPSTVGAFQQARASADERRAAGLPGGGVREIVRGQNTRGIDVIGDGEFYKRHRGRFEASGFPGQAAGPTGARIICRTADA